MNINYDPTIANRNVPRAYNIQLNLFRYYEVYNTSFTKLLRQWIKSQDYSEDDGERISKIRKEAMKDGIIAAIREAFRRKLEDSFEILCYQEYMKYYDAGICWVCERRVGKENLERGHLIDRVCGGTDLWSNVRPMCGYCNRLAKDLHDDLEEVMKWKKHICIIIKKSTIRAPQAHGLHG